MSRNNAFTTLKNATAAEKCKIVAGVNRLVALDALPCDLLDCIAQQFALNASPDELENLRGTLRVLLAKIEWEMHARQ